MCIGRGMDKEDVVYIYPMEYLKWSESESHSVVSDSLRPMDYTQSMEFSRPEYWSG